MTLEEVKEHLRVEHDVEDALIQTYLDAAEAHVAVYLGDDLPDPMPKPIEAAVLLLVADLYVNRERQSEVALYKNTAFTLLLNPYLSMSVSE